MRISETGDRLMAQALEQKRRAKEFEKEYEELYADRSEALRSKARRGQLASALVQQLNAEAESEVLRFNASKLEVEEKKRFEQRWKARY